MTSKFTYGQELIPNQQMALKIHQNFLQETIECFTPTYTKNGILQTHKSSYKIWYHFMG